MACLAASVDRQAEVAGALIEVERAVLKDRRAPVVEVLEADEVGAEPDQIAVVADQAFHLLDAGRLRLERPVARQQAGHHLGAARGQDLAHAGDAELLDPLPLLRRRARHRSGAILSSKREPVALGELGARSEQRGDGVVAERPERRCVGRVDRSGQRQRSIRRRQRQRKPGDLLDRDRQVLRPRLEGTPPALRLIAGSARGSNAASRQRPK